MSTTTLKRLLKLGAVAAAVVAMGGILVLEALRATARRRGVELVELPVTSEVRRRATGADYTDAYRMPLADTVTLGEADFGLGTEVFRDTVETIWEGRAPGLRYLASYHVSTQPSPSFTLSTVVFYESIIGRIYFFPVRFFHRRAVPFVVSGFEPNR